MIQQIDFGLFGGRRVRLVRQTEVAECGLAAIAMVATYHGLDIDLVGLRRRFEPSLRGATLKSLIDITDQLGLASRAVKLPLRQLPNLHLPAILHWDMCHFVVAERIRGDKVLIHNPQGRSVWMPFEELSHHFTGIALELRPADDFVPATVRTRLRLAQLWSRISGLKRALVQTLILSLVLQAFVLASPYYMQIALDSALPALDRQLLVVLALGFGLFTAFNAVATLLRGFVLLSAGTSLGFGISTNVARRLFRLPVRWFESRQVGDVLSRFQSVGPIRQFLTEGAVGGLLDGTLVIFTFALMLFYSPALTAVAFFAFALYAITRAISFAAQRTAQESVMVTGGREQTTLIESLRGIVTLRLFNREAMRHALWQSRLTDSMNAGVSLARIGIWQNSASTLIFGIEAVVSVWIAVLLLIDGGFSAGMMFAYLAYKTQFVQKATSLIDQGIAFNMLGLHLERLSDIALANEDPGCGQSPAGAHEFSGRIELRDVGFRYSATDAPILSGVNLVVEPGAHIAITGPSGCGKSTLVKVLLGLVEPVTGEVLADSVPLARLGYQCYRQQVSAVLQDDHVFAGSLAENIALFDDRRDMSQIVECAVAASLHDDIIAMPMGYESLVGDMGSTLSGGQKQRLFLARALYRRPTLLVLDEATSHLDQSRERAVTDAIANLGITRIIIAHRLETILAASRIYAMDGGKLADVTHQYDKLRAESRLD